VRHALHRPTISGARIYQRDSMVMDSTSGPAGRDQSSLETQERSPTRGTHQQRQTTGAMPTEDAQDPQTDHETRHSGDTSVAGYPSTTGTGSAAGPSAADAPQSAADPGLSKTPPSPSTRPGSLSTTAASSPGRPRYYLSGSESRGLESGAMLFLAVLAKFAAFTVSQRPERFKFGFPLLTTSCHHRTYFFPGWYVRQLLIPCCFSLTGLGYSLDSHHPRDPSTCSPPARYAGPKIDW
jgi:hypothetical protein